MNAIIGNDGIIDNAMEAKEKARLSSALEELEVMMMNFNMNGQMGSSALKEYMNKQVQNGKITSFKTMRKENTIQCIIEKDGLLFYAIPNNDEWKVVTTDSVGEQVGGVQLQVYTQDNVSKDGTFELGNSNKETDVVFYDEINDSLNFEIKEGIVNIYVYNDMNLTNSGMERSAIDIHEGATLNLYLENEAKMLVNSGYGKEGETASGFGAKGGPRRLCRYTCSMD